jgi:Helix-turn-helix domain
MTDISRYRTPPQYAEEIGVSPDKVTGWIKRGELPAVNVADRVGGRPRWRIPPDAIVEFERRRAASPPAKRTRRVRRDPQIIDIIK